uniref:CARMIL C-terminal domain-containing protein n=1 Tax=Sinocyclocheilus grahami TaxID=75366 RepID=A0A672N9Y8_SINGR
FTSQVVIETDKSTYSLRLQSNDHLDQLISHINFALSRIFNNSIYTHIITLSLSPISGGFSETYAALCDYNGITCKEEVQWDVDTIYHSQDNREFSLLDFSHLESGDLAVIVAAMAYNSWFTKLYCKDLRISSEVVEQILHTVSKSSSLEELTLENVGLKAVLFKTCKIEAFSLVDFKFPVGFSLSLSFFPGVTSLSQALCSSDDYSNSLLHLDLSKNPGILSGEDNLYLFLAQPNCLVHLDLSGTDCTVDSLFGALLRGCCADLSYLNLSKNSFSHRKVRETLPSFRQFFSSAFSLTHIRLDADLLCVIPAFSRHPSLKHLLLGKNFNIKGRVLDEVLQKLVHLVQEEECALQSLSLADSRLRSRGTVLVNALGSNACLKKVDLSGNGLYDTGARMLSKALQINTTLRSVTWDRNNTSATGFQDVARALEHNFTLQYMPIPLSDVTQAYRSAPERTEQALTKIQRALLRNNQTQRFSQKQALRLHQGLVTSTAEQVMERLCVRVQQQVCVLRGTGEGEELQAARQVLKEARNSRALYPSLCELAHVLSVDGPVRQRLDSLAGELTKAADKELQVIVDSMVSLCRELCPLSCAAAECLSPPLSSISERVSIPRSSIRTALMERAAQDINRALEEVKLSVVSYLTNSIVDQILQELYATHKTLVLQTNFSLHSSVHSEHVHKHRSSSRICSSSQLRQVSQMRRLEDGGTARRTHRHADILDVVEDDFGIMSTPQISAPLSRSASWEGLSTLPTQGSPLRHVTHVRPRPPRRHRTAHAPFETVRTSTIASIATPIQIFIYLYIAF